MSVYMMALGWRLVQNTAQLCLDVAQVLSKGDTNLRAALKRAFSSFWTKTCSTFQVAPLLDRAVL